MTSTYEQAAESGVKVSRLVSSYSEVANFFPAIYWLSELYQHMADKEEITRINMLESSRKLVYWTEVCLAIPGKDKYIRVLASQACYMWDLIIVNNDK